VGADVVGALKGGEEFGGETCGATVPGVPAGDLAQKGFAGHRDKHRQAERASQLRQGAEHREGRFGIGTQEKSHSGIEDEAGARDARLQELGDAPFEERDATGDDFLGWNIHVRGPAPFLYGMHDDEFRVRRCERGIEFGIGEPLDVVEIGNVPFKRPALHDWRERVDGNRNALFHQLRHNRFQPRDFDFRRDGGGFGIGRCRTDVERICATGHQRACASAASGARKRPPSENESSVMLRMPKRWGSVRIRIKIAKIADHHPFG